MKPPGAIILAGGQSRRMGRAKALLRLRPDGPRLIELVRAAVQPVAAEIVISTNTPANFAWLGLPLVGDAVPGAGPLAGLAAGLAALHNDWALLVACDMPTLNPAVLHYLCEQRRADDRAVIPLNAAGRPEPLCALYHRACLPSLHHQLATGDYAMRAWLARIAPRRIPAADLLPLDPDLRSFRNLNTPDDLAEAGR